MKHVNNNYIHYLSCSTKCHAAPYPLYLPPLVEILRPDQQKINRKALVTVVT